MNLAAIPLHVQLTDADLPPMLPSNGEQPEWDDDLDEFESSQPMRNPTRRLAKRSWKQNPARSFTRKAELERLAAYRGAVAHSEQ